MQILPHRGMSSAKVSKSGGSVKYGDADFSVFVCFFPFFIIPSDEPLVFRDEIRVFMQRTIHFMIQLLPGHSSQIDSFSHFFLFFIIV